MSRALRRALEAMSTRCTEHHLLWSPTTAFVTSWTPEKCSITISKPIPTCTSSNLVQPKTQESAGVSIVVTPVCSVRYKQALCINGVYSLESPRAF